VTGTSVPLPDGGARAERQASPGAGRAAGDDTRFTVVAPSGIGEISPGDDLARIVGDALDREGGLREGDVVVVTSKVVSKAEGRVVAATDREQAITDETVRVVATRPSPGGVLRIVENRLGLVMAAAGVDASNTPEGTVLLLPVDPDASARALRATLAERFGARVGVVVSDTAGRAWREGLTDLAIGVAGVVALDDLRGGVDSHGRELSVTVTAVADQIAAASELVRGKAAGRPVAVVRGLGRFVTDDDGPGARVLVRDSGTDMFREGSAEAYARGVAAGRGAAGPAGAAAVEPGEAERVAREAGYADGYREGFAEGFREGTGTPQQG
jgi:coenzyme F420-0:L-glutamate ligase/coenzyme F420-1:gamma-L-glutamate ligase